MYCHVIIKKNQKKTRQQMIASLTYLIDCFFKFISFTFNVLPIASMEYIAL